MKRAISAKVRRAKVRADNARLAEASWVSAGRLARADGVGRDGAPDAEGPLGPMQRAAWLRGWDEEDGIRGVSLPDEVKRQRWEDLEALKGRIAGL